MSVSPNPIAIGAKPAGAAFDVEPRMTTRKGRRQDDLGDEAGQQAVMSRGQGHRTRSRRKPPAVKFGAPEAMTYSTAAPAKPPMTWTIQ